MSQFDPKITIINDCIDTLDDMENAYYLMKSIQGVLEMRDFDDTEWIDHAASLLYRYIDEMNPLLPKMRNSLDKLSSKEKNPKPKTNLQRVK
jgi:hypothetical protein